jgi:hypothetical protein
MMIVDNDAGKVNTRRDLRASRRSAARGSPGICDHCLDASCPTHDEKKARHFSDGARKINSETPEPRQSTDYAPYMRSS